jgi:hypothetical protein
MEMLVFGSMEKHQALREEIIVASRQTAIEDKKQLNRLFMLRSGAMQRSS